MINRESMICAYDEYYSMDTFKTKVNNNMLVVGSSGSGKTRSIVKPNIYQENTSYIISDPKGTLYREMRDDLLNAGYKVKVLDFTNPEKSNHYNFFRYLNSEQDIIRIANILSASSNPNAVCDPFWEHTARMLVADMISYIRDIAPIGSQNMERLMQMMTCCGECIGTTGGRDRYKTDLYMEIDDDKISSFTRNQYKMLRTSGDKTWHSIVISALAPFGMYGSPQLLNMLSGDGIDIASIGEEKTALFVIVSDTDRSMDKLANIFYSQAMQVLCMHADRNCRDGRLPVHVRFILDDFAANVKIDNFPSIISTIRAREISAMLVVQSESQLEATYGRDGNTIIGNCDTYVYMGGNDIGTSKSVAERCNVPVNRILNMPVGKCWIFRRGQEPKLREILNLDEYMKMREDTEREVS